MLRIRFGRSLRLLRSLSLLLSLRSLCSYQVVGATVLMRFLYLRSLRLLRSLSLLLSLCSYQVVGATVLMRFLYLRDHPHGIDEEEDRPTTRASLQGRRGSLDVGTALISQATRAQEAKGAGGGWQQRNPRCATGRVLLQDNGALRELVLHVFCSSRSLDPSPFYSPVSSVSVG